MADETTAPSEAAETTREAGEAFAAAPMGDEGASDDWSPPATDDSGVAMEGDGLPINRRLRAIALVDAGKAEDEGGILSAEDIAGTAERLAAYDADYPRLAGATKAQLLTIAADEGVDISGASTNPDRAALIAAARPARI